jgi:hypothetical protein
MVCSKGGFFKETLSLDGSAFSPPEGATAGAIAIGTFYLHGIRTAAYNLRRGGGED